MFENFKNKIKIEKNVHTSKWMYVCTHSWRKISQWIVFVYYEWDGK